MLERQGKIYTVIVDNVSAETLMNEIIQHAEKGSVFYTEKFRSYDSLKFYGKHIAVDHGKIRLKRRHQFKTEPANGTMLEVIKQ